MSADETEKAADDAPGRSSNAEETLQALRERGVRFFQHFARVDRDIDLRRTAEELCSWPRLNLELPACGRVDPDDLVPMLRYIGFLAQNASSVCERYRTCAPGLDVIARVAHDLQDALDRGTPAMREALQEQHTQALEALTWSSLLKAHDALEWSAYLLSTGHDERFAVEAVRDTLRGLMGLPPDDGPVIEALRVYRPGVEERRAARGRTGFQRGRTGRLPMASEAVPLTERVCALGRLLGLAFDATDSESVRSLVRRLQRAQQVQRDYVSKRVRL